MHRRHALALTLLGLAAALAPPALGQGDPAASWPRETVRIVVPFSPGSMTDILARSVAEKLGQRWKQPVIVENRPGIAGTASVAKAPADGHTLMLTSNGHTIVGVLNSNLTFSPVKDFAGVTQVASMPSILIAPADGPSKSLKDLIAEAKAKPGTLNYASAGLGSATSIAAEVLRQTAGLDMVHVPYKGMPESQTSIIRGDSALAFSFFNVSGDLIQSGKMRALAVTGENRLPQLPDVPTFKEAGMPDFVYDAWFGVLAPAGTPKEIVAKASRDITEALAAPDMKQRFAQQGVELVSSAPEAFDAVVRSDAERYGKIFTDRQGK